MINPIEFSGVVQRTQDISIMKQNDDVRPQIEHINVQSQEHQKAAIQHEQVNKKDNADGGNTKYDAKEKGNGMYYESKNKKKKEESDGKVIKKQSGSFDVMA